MLSSSFLLFSCFYYIYLQHNDSEFKLQSLKILQFYVKHDIIISDEAFSFTPFHPKKLTSCSVITQGGIIMQQVFREVFVSPFHKETESDALKVLQDIRDAHPATSGWEEIKGFVEKLPNGKYRAVRVHLKCK